MLVNCFVQIKILNKPVVVIITICQSEKYKDDKFSSEYQDIFMRMALSSKYSVWKWCLAYKLQYSTLK